MRLLRRAKLTNSVAKPPPCRWIHPFDFPAFSTLLREHIGTQSVTFCKENWACYNKTSTSLTTTNSVTWLKAPIEWTDMDLRLNRLHDFSLQKSVNWLRKNWELASSNIAAWLSCFNRLNIYCKERSDKSNKQRPGLSYKSLHKVHQPRNAGVYRTHGTECRESNARTPKTRWKLFPWFQKFFALLKHFYDWVVIWH